MRLTPDVRSLVELSKNRRLRAYDLAWTFPFESPVYMSKPTEAPEQRIAKRRGHWLMLNDAMVFLRRCDRGQR